MTEDDNQDCTDRFFERTHDYRAAIKRSTFADDYDLTNDEIERIDFALNEYQAHSTDPEIASLRKARIAAPAAIVRANTALRKALSAFAEIESNPYAASTLIAALEGEFTGDQNSQIDELARAIQTVQRLSTIVDRAHREGQPSDGLPQSAAGSPGDPFVGRLLFRMRSIFRAVGERTESGLSDTIAAEGIQEFMALVGLTTARKTVQNNLSAMDETFPEQSRQSNERPEG